MLMLCKHGNDLVVHHDRRVIGDRMALSRRLRHFGQTPLAGTLIKVWQANASGWYRYRRRRWLACAASELLSDWPWRHRRPGSLRVRDDQDWGVAYEFDIYRRVSAATPFEQVERAGLRGVRSVCMALAASSPRIVGFRRLAHTSRLGFIAGRARRGSGLDPEALTITGTMYDSTAEPGPPT